MESGEHNQASPFVQTAPASEPGLATPILDACWNRIGVLGDRSCNDLAQHVHCRNCPTYSRAGMLLLNRELPEDYRLKWAAHFAIAKPDAALADVSVTVFRIGAEWLALDTGFLQEVTERRPMHSIPHRREGVILGLANVRGELLLCVSLVRLLGLGYNVTHERLREEHRRLIVVQADAQRYAFPVDDVQDVLRFHRAEAKPPPASVGRAQHSFTRGVLRWRERTVGWLDTKALFLHLNRNLL